MLGGGALGDRTGAIDIVAHLKDKYPHHGREGHESTGGGGSDGAVHTVQADVDQPDLLGAALVRMIHVHADWAPNGIKVLTALVDTGESSTYSVTYEIRATTTGSGTTIAIVATSASLKAETSVIIEAIVPVGSYIYAVLPATDVNKVGLEINFTII